jgi:5-dehydro-4-deoxyglucarate dehydratase
VLIYSRDWFHPGPALVERLTRNRTLLAWKEGQADIRRLQMIQRLVGDRLHWIGGAGDDMVPAYYAAGVRAYTSSVSNVSSRLARRLHDLACMRSAAAVGVVAPASHGGLSPAGDPLDDVMRELIVPLYAMRARRRGYEVTVMKELMNLLGLAGGRVRPPLPQLAAADRSELEAAVPDWRAAI